MKFSIIVPVYNASRYLRECLDSVLAQSYADWECICVNDGSTDDSCDILEKYALKDSRFKTVHIPNSGVSVARNIGLGLAKGEWICFMDSDDYVDSGWLAVAEHLISAFNPDLIRYNPNSRVRVYMSPYALNERRMEGVEAYKWGIRCFSEFGALWLCFINRRIVSKMRLSGLSYKEDSIFLLNLLPRISLAIECDYCGYYYRMTKGSLSKRKIDGRHCVRYMAHCKHITEKQREIALRYGAFELLQETIKYLIIHDVLEWNVRPTGRMHSFEMMAIFNKILILLNLKYSYGDLPRYKLSMDLWRLTGSRLGFITISLLQGAKDIVVWLISKGS